MQENKEITKTQKQDWTIAARQKLKYVFDLIGTERLRRNALQAIPFWIASLLTGLIAVVYTKFFIYCENEMRRMFHWREWSIFIMAPVCFFFAWLVVKLFAPNATGSGIPQVMAAIEVSNVKDEPKIDRLLNFKIIVVKIVSSLLMILGGGAIGKEGPIIQISGSVFRIVNKIVPASWPKLSRQNFILTGAAAGLAAAFNTPLGGVVFAMEELAKIHIRFFRTALFSAVIIAGLTAEGFLGPYLYLGYPDISGLSVSIFFSVALTAIVSGLLGGVMSKMILQVLKWKRSFSTKKTIAFIVFAGLVVASLAFFINQEILGSGKDIMNRELFTTDKYATWHTVVMRLLGTTIAFNTGAAGGVFAPSLAAGASVGGFICSLFHFASANANIIILSGMVGFLTGVTKTPFTSAILVLEMTDRHSVIFHLMLAALLSNLASLLIDNHSLYEHLKKRYVEEGVKENKQSEQLLPPE